MGILTDEESQAAKLLVKLGFDTKAIKNEIFELIGEPVGTEATEQNEEEYSAATTTETEAKTDKKKAGKALTQFGRDLTVLAKEGKLDPVIGRKNEIERIMMILSRRTKNNPILLDNCAKAKVRRNIMLRGKNKRFE